MIKVSCDHQSASRYLQVLFEIKRSMLNHCPIQQDQQWLSSYNDIISRGMESNNLPDLLALIHPDFYTKGGKSIEAQLSWKSHNKFVSGITKTDPCQAKEYTGVPCIFNVIPDIRGKCQADHRWPNSLGGPSILDNRLILCRYHNGMKSNDISHFKWQNLPNWFSNYLGKLYRLKS